MTRKPFPSHRWTNLVVMAAWLVAALGAGAGPAAGQDCPSLVGVEDFGPLNQGARDVVVAGQYAYTADIFGLTVYDISDPENLTPVGEVLLPEEAFGVAVSGTTAFVADQGSLQVVDVADPGHPVVVASVVTRHARGVVVSEDTLYVADQGLGLRILDVTDPAHPTVLGELQTTTIVRDVTVVGTTAYLAAYDPGLLVVDVSNPASPTVTGSLDAVKNAFAVAVAGNTAYVGAISTGLAMVDVTDPASPALLGTFASPDARGVAVSGTAAYVADRAKGVLVVDVSDPSQPSLLGTAYVFGSASGIALSGTTVFLSAETLGLLSVDVSNPHLPTVIGDGDSGGFAFRVAVSGSMAYVADRTAGLQIVDLSDPDHPSLAGELRTSHWADDIAISGSTAYLAVAATGLQTVDVSDPEHPVPLGSADTPQSPGSVTVAGDIAYLTTTKGLSTVDVSDPAHPTLLGSVETSGSAESVAVSGSTAYVALSSPGMDIVDVSDPAHPTISGTMDTAGRVDDAEVASNILFLVEGDAGLEIMDISDPAHPSLLGTLKSVRRARSVAVLGQLAFVATTGSDFHVVDVSDPTNPQPVTSVTTLRWSSDVALDPAALTAWLADGALLEGVDIRCLLCPQMDLAASPSQIAVGGETSTITLTVQDQDNNPLPGQTVTGSTTLGSLSAFTDQGDGSYTATLTSGSTGGTATVTASLEGTVCSTSTEVIVSGGGPPQGGTWIPVAIHAGGAHGSSWRTALGILGTGSATGDVTVRFESGSGPVTRSIGLAPGQQLLLPDVVDWLQSSGAGALSVSGAEPFLLTSRTYTASGDACFGGGTLGQFLAASDQSPVLSAGQSAWIPMLSENTGFRTNIALTNTGQAQASARITLFDGEGAQLGSFEMTLEPGAWVQDNRPYASRFGVTDLETGYARVEVLSGSGIIGYGSVVDNTTNDPTTMPLVPVVQGAAADVWIAVASHASGAHGSRWRTDLGLLNAGTSDAVVTVTGLGSSTTAEVCAGCQVRVEDIVGTLGATGSGALHITASQPIIATSRTFNLLAPDDPCWPSGSLGQYLPGSSLDTVLGTGEVAWLPDLVEHTDYRTNIAFTNTGGSQASVEVTLYDAQGQEVGSYQVDLNPGQWLQDNRPYAKRFGVTQLEVGAARVEVLSGSGIVGYASVVDNTTNDPTTIPLARLLSGQ